MPLIKSGSQKAFKKNVETEMDANPGKKNRAQNLAIAYSVQRKNKKAKAMADGGEVEITAEDESRPMPDQEHADRKQISRDGEKKALMKPDWNDDTWSSQASESKSAAQRKDRTFTDDEMDSADSSPTDEAMNMLDDHSTMDGEEINAKDEHEASEDSSDSRELDMLDAHETEREQELSHGYAKGGKVMNPKLAESHKMADGDADEHYSSIADAILAKKRNAKAMADGGEVDLEENAMLHGNQEDQMSYKAIGKEMYSEKAALEHDQPHDSNEMGDDREDEAQNDHDMSMVDKLRRKMKMRA